MTTEAVIHQARSSGRSIEVAALGVDIVHSSATEDAPPEDNPPVE